MNCLSETVQPGAVCQGEYQRRGNDADRNCRSALARDLARSGSKPVHAVGQTLPRRLGLRLLRSRSRASALLHWASSGAGSAHGDTRFVVCGEVFRPSYIDRRLARNLRTAIRGSWSGAKSSDPPQTVGVSLLAIWRAAVANRCMRWVRHYQGVWFTTAAQPIAGKRAPTLGVVWREMCARRYAVGGPGRTLGRPQFF